MISKTSQHHEPDRGQLYKHSPSTLREREIESFTRSTDTIQC